MIDLQIIYKIQEEREKQELTLRALSDLSGVSKTHIHAIEQNRTHPTLYTMCLLAIALQVELDNLYEIRLSHM